MAQIATVEAGTDLVGAIRWRLDALGWSVAETAPGLRDRERPLAPPVGTYKRLRGHLGLAPAGESLAQPPAPVTFDAEEETRLDGDDPAGQYAQLLTVAQSIDFTVEDHECDGSTNGECCHSQHRIRVETMNAPAQRVKTLAHDIVHAILNEKFDSRALAELEAESTAYVVCQALGIDNFDYSFGYVTVWAGSGDQAIAGIKASCERIQKTAATILRAFEPAASEEAA